MQQEASMITRDLTKREQELVASIELPCFRDMVEEVRASLPPTRYTRSQYMRAYQGLAP